MLTITLIALVLAIPLSSTVISTGDSVPTSHFPPIGGTSVGLSGQVGYKVRKTTISATLFTRIVAIALLFAAALSYNCFSTVSLESLDAGVGLYSGLIHATTVTQSMEVFLLVSGALILLP
jgi:opacity protein-like surface antigen